MYIFFNTVIKLSDLRIQPQSYTDFLLSVSLCSCIVFNSEWLVGLLTVGYVEFFSDNWYRLDTAVNIMNWGSYLTEIQVFPYAVGLAFPNIAFLRMLRFLKPLGRIRVLLPSKVVVQTVKSAITSMAPVLALLAFALLFFGVVGIYLFGSLGQLYYRCGRALTIKEAFHFYNPEKYKSSPLNTINFKNCSVNMPLYQEYLKAAQDNNADLSNFPWTTIVNGAPISDLSVGGQQYTCAELTPLKLCTCPQLDAYNSPVCVDLTGSCGTDLCFMGDVPPISVMLGFDNMAVAALTVMAVFYQKKWSLLMDACTQATGLPAVIYFMITVFLGSFCLLNLTVATVGQNYARVKKEAEAKMAKKEEEVARKAKIQAERDEMKRKQGKGSTDDNNQAGDHEVILLFDPFTIQKLWLLGFVGMPFIHRIYLKTYSFETPPFIPKKEMEKWRFPFCRSWFWFVIRCISLNYFLLGWISDLFLVSQLNKVASEWENERIKAKKIACYQKLKSEIARVSVMQGASNNLVLAGRFIIYPQNNLELLPCSKTRQYLEGKLLQFQIENADLLDELGEEDEEDDLSQEDSSDSQGIDSSNSSHEPATEGAKGKADAGTSFFALLADFVVLLNAVGLAASGFNLSMNPFLSDIGYFALFFFIAEAAIKGYAYGGLQYYLVELSNIFDFSLVVIPVIGKITTFVTGNILGLGSDYIFQMVALESFRAFRIAKLVRHLTGLRRLTAQAFGSPTNMFYTMLVTLIFIAFSSLFGHALFKSSVAFAKRRNDYQYFAAAMLALCEFLFGESYFHNLEIGYSDSNVIGLFFFVAYYYLANFIVLRIFIALIMENFEFDEDEKIAMQIQLFQRDQVLRNDLIDGKAKSFPLEEQWGRLRKQNLDPDKLKEFQDRWSKAVAERAAEEGVAGREESKPLWEVVIESAENQNIAHGYDSHGKASFILTLMSLYTALRMFVYDLVENRWFNLLVATAIVMSVVVLQIDPPTAPIFPDSVRHLIDVGFFTFFTFEILMRMMAFGLFHQAQPVKKTLEFPQGKPPFFSVTEEGGWNTMDFIFILILVVDVFSNASLGNFKTIRIIRVIRPLQSNVPIVKSLLAALFSSLTKIFHVLNLLGILSSIFGIIGLSLFQGRMNSCNDDAIANFEQCIGNNYGGLPKVPCNFMDPKHPNGTLCSNKVGSFLYQQILVPRVWSTNPENFENFGDACITLLRLVAADTLRPIFHSMMDIPRRTQIVCSDGSIGDNGCPNGEPPYIVSEQPSENPAGSANVLFAITYIFIANAFVSQLVIGVMIDNIRRQTGTALYTEDQRKWYATGETMKRNLSLKLRPVKPVNKFSICGNFNVYMPGREQLYDILNSETYDNLMMIIIILNTLWMATEHFPSDSLYRDIKVYLSIIFTIIYTVELVAKMYSFGVITWLKEPPSGQHVKGKLRVWSPYFRDNWNCFDFCIVMLSLLDASGLLNGLTFLRLLRVLRLFRLVRRVKTLQLMVQTLLGAIPSILSALFFLGIWIFLFASIGMDQSMFPNVKIGIVIDSRWNFTSLYNSMMLLFRIATGDSWFDIVYDGAVLPPYCTANPAAEHPILLAGVPGDCGIGSGSYIYFLGFWLGCNFVFGPLFVATLINYFFEAQVDVVSLFNRDDCELYASVWSEFDENGIGRISIENLRPFIERLAEVGHRVGFRTSESPERFKSIWSRVMADPLKFPEQGLLVAQEKDRERLGLSKIDRNNIIKASLNTQRAKQIRKYIYENTFVQERNEVGFHYLAKVLVIHQENIKAPLTTSDLINRGAAFQQFMGLLNYHEIPGREGKENQRWQALEIHNRLLSPLDAKKEKSGARAIDVSQLPRIFMAIAYVKQELRPRRVGDEEVNRPTGTKREALVRKIASLQDSFDEIISSLVDNILWGVEDDDDDEEEEEHDEDEGHSVKGIIDLHLEQIMDETISLYAQQTCTRLSDRMKKSSMPERPHTQRYTSNMLESGKMEPRVSTVPRGWLNARRTRNLKRVTINDWTADEKNKEATVTALQRFSAVEHHPGHQPLSMSNFSSELRSRLQRLSKNDVWKSMYKETFSRRGGAGAATPASTWKGVYAMSLQHVQERMQSPQGEPPGSDENASDSARRQDVLPRQSFPFFPICMSER